MIGFTESELVAFVAFTGFTFPVVFSCSVKQCFFNPAMGLMCADLEAQIREAEGSCWSSAECTWRHCQHW
jgi:hypothetical protein